MELGELLTKYRKEAGLTIDELAEKSGVPKGTINKIIAGTTKAPTLENVRALAYAMGKTLDDFDTTKKSRTVLPAPELELLKRYRALDAHGKRMVDMVLEEETSRMLAEAMEEPEETKVIPLIGNSFAAGSPEPDFGNMWEDYNVPASSRAEFAIRINGDSMEPYLPDGSIALGVKTTPRDGDVAALLLDGEFLCKQFSKTPSGDIRLYSLNRSRSDADVNIPHDSGRQLLSFGVILMDKKVALP